MIRATVFIISNSYCFQGQVSLFFLEVNRHVRYSEQNDVVPDIFILQFQLQFILPEWVFFLPIR